MLLTINGNWLGLKTSWDGNPGTVAPVAKGIRHSDPRVWRRGWELGGPWRAKAWDIHSPGALAKEALPASPSASQSL